MKTGQQEGLPAGAIPSRLRPDGSFRWWLLGVIGLAVAYYAAARLGQSVAIQAGNVTAVWPPSGIALAAILLLGYRIWPGIWLGGFAANAWLLFDFSHPERVARATLACVVIGFGHIAQAIIGARLLRSSARPPNPFERTRDVFKFFALSPLMCLVSCTVGVATLLLTGFATPATAGPTWLTWWLGDTCGVILMTPLLVLWSCPSRSGLSRFQWLEALALLGATAIYGWLLLSSPLLGRGLPLAFTVIPFLVWAAFRFTPREATTVIFLLNVLAIQGTARGLGAFAGHGDHEAWLIVQAFVLIMSVTGLILATMVQEGRQAQAALRQSGAELEQRVAVRTNELATANAALQADLVERQRMEAALRASEERLRIIYSESVVGIALVDIAGRPLLANPACQKMLGYTEAELQGKAFIELTHPDDGDLDRRWFREMVAGDRDHYRIEKRFFRKDGEVIWANVSVALVRDEKRKPQFAISLVDDITQRKQAEQELKFKNVILSTQQEASIDGILVVDEATRVLSCNRRFVELWGIPQPLIEQKDDQLLLQFVTSQLADPAAFLQRVQYLYEHRREISREEIQLKDGRVFDRYSAPMIGPDEQYFGRVWYFRDLTERKRLEALLQRTEELYRRAIAGAEAVPYALDFKTRSYAFMGEGIRELTGFAPPEMNGEVWTRIIQQSVMLDETAGLTKDEALRRVAKGEIKRWRCDMRITTRDGKTRWISDAAVLNYDESGRPTGSIGILQDITERKRLEEQLIQSQKMETVGKLAGGIAHEFNNIMTTIIGQSELMLSDLPAAHPLAHNAAEIRKAADRAAKLTRQLLAYGRQQMLRSEILNLNTVLENLENILPHLLGHEVDLRVVPGAGLAAVKADAGQIEQVIINLAINARAAMPHGGKLTIETANVSLKEQSVGRHLELKPGNYVTLTVTDTGTGMSEAVKRRVFEPFFTTKDVGKGPGLGLAACHGIIKQSGGHINVYSEADKGTTFKVYLPAVEPPQRTAAPPPGPSALPPGTGTILLVEDDPALREMAGILLERLGYTVLTATNGINALRLVEQRGQQPVELLFTDLVMPQMDGRQLFDRVRSLHPETKVLFASAYPQSAMVHQGVLDASVAFLQKPFTPSQMLEAVRKALAG